MTQPRRNFLKTMGASAAGLALASTARAADGTLRVAVIGPGGMGSNHLSLLVRRKDVQVAAVCDVDQERLARAADLVKKETGTEPLATQDLRKILSDRTIDAVFIATPDHWHAPAAILALEAGKHVYVEKPCSHNIREGRLMSDAVARTGKVLQVGTQSRSTGFVREAIERLRSGAIGDILVAKAWNSQLRGSIGKREPAEPPAHLDFDTWLGPAPAVPYRPNLLHGVWRWWYDFGAGDVGNDGVHDIDVALWGLGVKTHPERIAGLGRKLFFNDDQQYPDTYYTVCDYAPDEQGKRKQFIFEMRIWSPYVQEGYENGAAFYGTKGYMILGHSVGWRLYGPRSALIEEKSGASDLQAHHENFFNAIRTGGQTNASIDAGHLAATVVHLTNITARVGRTLNFNPQTEQIEGDDEANALVKRAYRDHWATPRGA